MVETIEFNGVKYPNFQSEGYAAQFAIPYALKVCTGKGYDVGCNRKDWSLPGSIPIEPAIDDRFHAMKFPYEESKVDYIFSSHCSEHIPNWVDVLDYWCENLKDSGVLFLYLPDFSQEYWLPWNNRKHCNIFTPEIIKKYFVDKKFKNIFCSGIDLNNSFMIFGEK